MASLTRKDKKIARSLTVILLFIIVQSILVLYSYHQKMIPEQTHKSYTYTSEGNDTSPKIAIIIDDFGENRNGVKEILSINKPLTCAIMPFLDFSRQDAVNAHKKGFEVIVHLPMQSTNSDIASWLGPKPIKLGMTDEEIKRITLESVEAVPYSVGVNIHMGSMASENKRVISNVMEVLKQKNLYFIDSKTSRNSICKQTAKNIDLPFAERDIFLENTAKSKSYIKSQLENASRIALKTGKAIVIGHVGSAGGKVTAQSITEMIPVIENQGISLVFVSEIL